MASRPLVYIAFRCDNANTPESRRVGCLSTVSTQIRDYVARAIVEKKATYQPSESLALINPKVKFADMNCYQQRSQFLRDWDKLVGAERREKMNERLRGIYLDTALGGREYTPADFRN